MMLQNPERIVIDLKGIAVNQALKNLSTKVKPSDPNILDIRVGQFTPKVSRIVIDLKNSARVKIFSLPPVAPYQNRLVIDVYPVEKDDLANLLNKLENKEVKKKEKLLVLIRPFVDLGLLTLVIEEAENMMNLKTLVRLLKYLISINNNSSKNIIINTFFLKNLKI